MSRHSKSYRNKSLKARDKELIDWLKGGGRSGAKSGLVALIKRAVRVG